MKQLPWRFGLSLGAFLLAFVAGAPADAAVQSHFVGETVIEAPSGSSNSFGYLLAADTSSLAVAAYGSSGKCAVYVYERDPFDFAVWLQTARLVAPDFGCADGLDLDGLTLVVGVSKDEAAYVFERDPVDTEAWSRVATLRAADGEAFFGTAVGVSGETVAVGARGAVYLFERDFVSGDWLDSAKLTRAGDWPGFGAALSLSGSTLAVSSYDLWELYSGYRGGQAILDDQTPDGAVPITCGQRKSREIEPLDDVDFLSFSLGGESYVEIDIDADEEGSGLDSMLGLFNHELVTIARSYDDEGPGEDRSDDSFIYEALPPGDYFIAVASESDWDFDGDGANTTGDYSISLECAAVSGGVFVFERDATRRGVWTERAQLRPPPDADRFGESVSLDGPVLVVTGRRSAWVYGRQGTARWKLERQLSELSSDGDGFERFNGRVRGNSVLVAGEESKIFLFDRDRSKRDGWGMTTDLDAPLFSIGAVALGPEEAFVGLPAEGDGTVHIYQRTPICADDFEGGDLSVWSQVKRKVGLVAPGLGASEHALEVIADGKGQKSFVRTRLPEREPLFSLSFLFRADDLEIGKRSLELVKLSGGKRVARIQLEAAGDGYLLRLLARENKGKDTLVGEAMVARGEEVLVDIEWRQATGPSHRNGTARLAVDGRLTGEWIGMDSDKLKVTEVRLGLPGGAKGARGSFLIDLFRSAR